MPGRALGQCSRAASRALEGINGVNGTFRSGVISTGDGVEPLPQHQVHRGLQAVTDIVHVTAIRDHFIDPAVCEVRHEFDLLIDDRDPLEVIAEGFLVAGSSAQRPGPARPAVCGA